MPIRYGILAGVSTDAQVGEDKGSLADQVSTCRRAIQQQGGQEVGCWQMDGYSRSGYDSLDRAMSDIPPLAAAIRAAEGDEYDVLILDNYDRLGDLAPMVFTRLGKFRKQIHSARQGGRIHDPADYDPYDDDASSIGVFLSGLIQKYRINKIRRGWNIGIPARVERGLHPLSIPFGYRKTVDGEPVALVPEQGDVLRMMMRLFMDGENYTEIARRADATGIRPPRGGDWNRVIVRRMLENPFYAGLVRYGAEKKRVPQPMEKWKLEPGRHEALWDEATWRAALMEVKRRQDGKRNFRGRYPFSGLTRCGVCGDRIGKHGKPPFEYLSCNTRNKHWSMRYERAVEHITAALVRELDAYHAAPPEPVDVEPMKQRARQLAERRQRVQEGYETGLYSAAEAKSKLDALTLEREAILRRIEREQSRAAAQERWLDDIGGAQNAAKIMPHRIRTGDGTETNQMLSAIIETITLDGDAVRFVWRGGFT